MKRSPPTKSFDDMNREIRSSNKYRKIVVEPVLPCVVPLVTVVIAPTPVVLAITAGAPAPTQAFAAVGNPGGGVFAWTLPLVAGVVGFPGMPPGNQANATVAALAGGHEVVQVQYTALGQSPAALAAVTVVAVTVAPSPVAMAMHGGQAAPTQALVATGLPGGGTFVWDLPGASGFIRFQGGVPPINNATATIEGVASGAEFVRVRYTHLAVTASATVQATVVTCTVNPLAPTLVEAVPAPTQVLQAQGLPGGGTFVWDLPDATGTLRFHNNINPGNNANATVEMQGQGQERVRVRYTASGVTASAIASVTVRVRLLIGHAAAGNTQYYRVWIPSRRSGELTIRVANGTTPTMCNVQTGGVVALTDRTGGVFTCDFGAAAPAWHDIDLDIAGQARCQFTQAGAAQTGAGGALVPWTFWFWPYGRDSAHAATAIGKLAKLLGTDENAAKAWETTHHHQNVYTYEGHCHGAANASALFAEPGDQSVTNPGNGVTVDFTRAELKLLAAEYVINFGREQVAWELKGTSGRRMDQERMCREAERYYLLGYLKPAGPHDRATLRTALTDDNVADDAGWADYFRATTGRTVAFPREVAESFGQAACTFFEALLENLGVQQVPLVSNIRSGHVTDGPASVWNQVIYKFEAQYVEAVGASPNPERVMDVVCVVYANDDNDAGGVNARANAATVTDHSEALVFDHQYRIVFGANGDPNPANALNRWATCERRVPGTASINVYAPSDLSVLRQCVDVRQTYGNERHEGNPYVTQAVKQILTFNHDALKPP